MTSSLIRAPKRTASHAACYPLRTCPHEPPFDPATRAIVLSVEALPRRHRLTVEEMLVDVVRSAPTLDTTAVYDYDAQFFTRWYSDGPGTVGCEQTMTATTSEVVMLRKRAAEMCSLVDGARIDVMAR